jgi:hypothetical protein
MASVWWRPSQLEASKMRKCRGAADRTVRPAYRRREPAQVPDSFAMLRDDRVLEHNGTVVFVDAAGVTRTLDIVSAPFGLDSAQVHDTAVPVELPDDAGATTGVRVYLMHPVLCMESRVHNVIGLPGFYDTEQGRKQLRLSILFAREFFLDVLDGRIDAEDPARTVLKLNERQRARPRKHRRRARNSQASAHFVATYMTAAVATCAKSTFSVDFA